MIGVDVVGIVRQIGRREPHRLGTKGEDIELGVIIKRHGKWHQAIQSLLNAAAAVLPIHGP
ncbi:hypothetical protein D3C80_1981200 [compost metagenome]